MSKLSIRPLDSGQFEQAAHVAVREHCALFDAPELPRRVNELHGAWSKRGAAEGVFTALDQDDGLAGLCVVRCRENGWAWPATQRLSGPLPPASAALELVWVRPDLRRQGIAAALAARAVEYAAARACDELLCEPRGDNGLDLALALGFVQRGRQYRLLIDSSEHCGEVPIALPRKLVQPLFNATGFWLRQKRGDPHALYGYLFLLFACVLLLSLLEPGWRQIAQSLLFNSATVLAAILACAVLLIGAGAIYRAPLRPLDALKLSAVGLTISGALCAALSLALLMAGVEYSALPSMVGVLICCLVLVPGERLYGRWTWGAALLAALAAGLVAQELGMFSLNY
ncbi:MAG: GNAT family N-acetyltransferase [Candidatus Alcyoniella australis]|nr:GNAT family N-acetyltransferase [Candidatus Alcyoniella australis]